MTKRAKHKAARTDEKAEGYISSVGGYECFFDGCCEPRNPGGTAGYGAVIFKGGERVWETSGTIPPSPTTSNNVAEYLAFTAILDWFIEQQLTGAPILVKGDSNLVIQQCFGSWRIKKGFYAETAREAKKKVARFKNLHGTWIGRDKNAIADDLSKAHLRAAGVEFRIQPEERTDA